MFSFFYHFSAIFWEGFWKDFGRFARNVHQEGSRKVQGKSIRFQEGSRKVPGRFKESSRKVPGRSKESSRKVQRKFKESSRKEGPG
jgi:hypothetical protein